MVADVANKFKEIISNRRINGADGESERDWNWLKPVLVIALIALTWACWGRTLTSYFLADDFGEVAYVSRIAAGDWNLFWSNWTGNFMQIPGMAVYRPWLVVTLLVDCLIWKSNAIGYYLTNMLYYTGDALLLFAVGIKLTTHWGKVRSYLTSALAAALFVVNPLHCESISWVVGRVDTACCFYYLASLLCYLNWREKKQLRLQVAAVTLFWIGMFVKEMPIGLPILATAISFFLHPSVDAQGTKISLIGRVVAAFREASAYWISTVAYFGIRVLALGTILGGYSGAIGDGQEGSAVKRWFDISTYERVLMPFGVSLFPATDSLVAILKGCYVAITSIVVLKVLRREIPWTLAAIAAVWLFSAALPIYKLWGVGMDLEGARFCFFLTVPFSFGLCMMAMAPSNQRTGDKAATAFSVLVLLIMVGVLYKTSLRSNASWVHAGKEVKSVAESASALVKEQPEGKLIVLGIPKKNSAAHLIYNGATFRTMLNPPFTDTDMSKRFLTYDPIFYGPDQHINSARFKTDLANPQVKGPFIWNSKTHGFANATLGPVRGTKDPIKFPLTLDQSFQVHTQGRMGITKTADALRLASPISGDGLTFSGLKVDPRNYDYLEVAFKVPAGVPDKLPFQATWTGNLSSGLTKPESTLAQRYTFIHNAKPDGSSFIRIPLSHFWKWFACGSIDSLTLLVPQVPWIEIQSVQLVADSNCRPTLALRDQIDDGSGVFVVRPDSRFQGDVSRVLGAKKLRLECSKPEYFFDQVEEDQQGTAVFRSVDLESTVYDAVLPAGFMPSKAYCEVRVCAVDERGKRVGEYSEPVIVYSN